MAAKSNTPYSQLTTLILFLCLVLCKSSSARPLINDMNSQSVGAEKGSHQLMKGAPATASLGKVGGIVGLLVMQVLPKGATPPSAPSQRNNGVIPT